MHLDTRHCCAHWNENTTASWMQLHGTTSGGIHCGALWLRTWMQHESIGGSLNPPGQAFPTSNDQGDYLPSGFAGRTRRCNSVEIWNDGSWHCSILLTSLGRLQWCSTKGAIDGFATVAGLDEDASLELAKQSLHDGSRDLNSGIGRSRDVF